MTLGAMFITLLADTLIKVGLLEQENEFVTLSSILISSLLLPKCVCFEVPVSLFQAIEENQAKIVHLKCIAKESFITFSA
jgi:hypothetical protein